MVPVGDWAKERLAKLSDTDLVRDESKVGSGFGKNVSNWLGRDMVYPTNVIHMATECANKNHSAAFPIDLPKWFVRLFTQPGDLVLDPFVGSGTTALAAMELGRNYLGIDLNPDYIALSMARVSEVQIELPNVADEKGNYQIDNSDANAEANDEESGSPTGQ